MIRDSYRLIQQLNHESGQSSTHWHTVFPYSFALLCSGLIVSYQRKKKSLHNGSAARITDTETTQEKTPVENGKLKAAKEKKAHKWGCGSDKSKSDIRPSTINIMYGTQTGKTKVFFVTQIPKQFKFIIMCIAIKKFDETL